eukprot:CAMPEP_0196584258 /NCGR_PEP_ID=MMETSP1081-20130531/46377_1 /TAXON_ID=36882 /ORGANISM="Pyramimonas amylifera, Strain CCMP720" /LENGTH=238 /DNA_ID=CAMNT_0041905397 /DNA_START=31 /DNA_END=747 /DNA_ORIENTATION=+
MEQVIQTVQDFKKTYVEDTAKYVLKNVDSLYTTARSTSEEQYAYTKERADQILTTAKAHSATALAQYQEAEEHLIKEIKVGVAYCREQPYETAVLASGVALVLLPGPRRMLYRNTIGLFQSEEAVYRNAAAKLESLQVRLQSHYTEAKLAEEEALSAAKHFKESQLALRNSKGMLETLNVRAQRMEMQAASLQAKLRSMPGKEALKLRSELAVVKSGAHQQKSSVGRLLKMASKTLHN